MVKQDVLFAVIRAGLGLPSSLPQFSYEDIQQLKQIGSRQSILQIIWAGLKTSSLRQEWKQEIEADVYNCIMRYVWREESLRRVRTALDGAGIPYILLKGAVIQHLYPEGWMRSSNDIDILVREDDLPLAVKAIEDNTSFKAKYK